MKIEFRYDQLATVQCAKKSHLLGNRNINQSFVSVFYVCFSLYNNIYLTDDPLDEEV